MLLKLRELFLELGDIGLQSGLFQGLGFLVCIDLLLGDELVERLSGVLCKDGIDSSSCVLRKEGQSDCGL